MKYASILEKLLCLYNILISSWIDIVVLAVILFLLFLTLRKSIALGFGIAMILMSYLSLLIFTVYTKYTNLSVIFNNLIDNMFTSIYFPSVYVYLFVLLSVNIIFIISILNRRLSKVYKIINGIVFGFINFLFVIIIDIVGSNNVDVLDKLSLFGNSNLIAMLELSVGIFIVWIIATLVVYVIDKITELIIIHRDDKELVSEPVNIIDPVLELDVNNIEEDKERITSFLPNVNYSAMVNNNTNVKVEPIYNVNNNFDLSDLVAPKQDLSVINSSDTIIDKIINKELPVVEEKVEVDNYTLNDYRIFNNMLKDIKEFTQSNTINIDKNLEYRLITKYSTEKFKMFKKMLENYSN